MISWWCAYLKVYYPVEYFAAVLDCSTKTNLIPAYIKECQRLEINVKLPDINISTTRYEIDKDGSIVAPLGIIKNVGGKAVDEILRARQDGPFISMKNFQERIVKRVCNIRVVDSLTKAGCFESLGIGTADLEQRGKDLCELVPIFQEIPVLTTHSDETLDKDEIKKLYADVFTCANASDKTMIAPYIGGAKPGIFIINSPQKNEDKNFSKDGTKFLIKTLTKADININAAYYTNPCKCFHKDGAKPSKECVNGCLEFLKREIKIVKPRLIICMSSDYIKMFTSAKPTMRDLHGKTIYCKEFDCYVLFSYSPQYLFYGDDKQPLIDRFIASLKELFTGDSDDSDFDDFD
ncbi:MAG: hypothetical protein EOL93_11115 [Epsilonproteobacteria bacterium]|nr:hypothetical protein [Campylobacterota bacterium]